MDGQMAEAAARLRSVAALQGGVFTVRQARVAGFSSRSVQRRIAGGSWHRFAGAWCAGPLTDEDVALAWAVVLTAGPESVLSGPLALRLWGRPVARRDPFVVIPPDRHVPVTGGRPLRVPVASGDRTTLRGLPIAGEERALTDALMRLPFRNARNLLDQAIREKWTTAGRLRHRVYERRRRAGVVQLRTLAARASDGTYSEAEHRIVRLLRRCGLLGWQTNYPVTDARGQLVALVDVAFVGSRLAVEVDGRAFHSDEVAFQVDRTRQNRLVQLGWTVLRFTWDDIVQRPDHVIATIRSALR